MDRLLFFLFGLGFETLWEFELDDVLLGARPVPGTDQDNQDAKENEMYRVTEKVV